MIARLLTLLLAAVVGAAIGFVLTFTHRQYVVDVGGVGIPLGVIAALAIVAALLIGMRLVFADRAAPLAGGAGVVLATALLALPAANGSLLVLDDPVGYAWAVGPAALTLAVVVWPTPRRRAAGSG